jgi:subtilisin family serine protease
MQTKSKWVRNGSAVALAASIMLSANPALANEAASPADAEPTTEDRPVVAMGGPLGSYGSNVAASGGVDPLKGLIRTFEGDLGPHVGRIRTFEGEVDPSKGLIRTFEGDIDPYKGLIRTFWGDLTPTAGDVDPKVGRIRTFTDSFLPSSSAISAAWATAQQSGDYRTVISLLEAMLGQTKQQWQLEITNQTGQDFEKSILEPFLKKWKVDLKKPDSLKNWEVFDRQSFLLDWYDNVLNYSGMDRTDHWMNAVRWTPALTQVQGGGTQSVIGLIDFFAANDADVRSKVVYSGGYADVNNAHGAAVGSLIVASHDGKGIMGIAPNATIAAYNPFDSSFTASWADVQTGIMEVGTRGASVINLSLGVPGYTLPAEWRGAFTNSVIDGFKDHTIYVIAAGNDGSVQTTDIDFTSALDSTFIVVGSVDPYGRISGFSNTPGTACITTEGQCANNFAWNATDSQFTTTDYLKQSGLLMNRFLVAPGELILVSDGEGGVTRMSGTSFAAPLVSGAIALIQDRWPWLKQYPRDVAKIILESAQDLGAPGVDPIYGHGLLDINAAQSALDFGNLKYYLVDGASTNEIKVETLRSEGLNSIWSAGDLYFTAFEKIDSAERDFLIPLSSRLFNGSVDGRAFQKHMYDLFMAWFGNNKGTGQFASLTDTANITVAQNANGWSYSMRGKYKTVDSRYGLKTQLSSTVAVSAPNGAMSFAVGSGDGAVAIAGYGAMQLASDFDPNTGGNDPLLGFASGKSHMAARMNIAPNVKVGIGITNAKRDIDSELLGSLQSATLLNQRQLLGDYAATATNLRVDYAMNDRTNIAFAFTQLNEDHAFLGVRSLARDDFGGGTTSRSATVSADIVIGDTVQLFGSATVAQSHSNKGASLRLADTTSTAWQMGVAKNKLLGSRDHLRLSVAQPLQIEDGVVEFKSVGVVNRETGEKGVITQRLNISEPGDRRFRVEAHYGATMASGLADVALFSSYEINDVRPDIARWTLGGKVRVSF